MFTMNSFYLMEGLTSLWFDEQNSIEQHQFYLLHTHELNQFYEFHWLVVLIAQTEKIS